jgi:acetoin utilization deacetylase AcuC-like enzyme
MLAAFHEHQLRHQPTHFMVNGNLVPSPEQPHRAQVLLEALQASGIVVEEPELALADRALASVHSPDYLDYLRGGFEAWRRQGFAGTEVIPKIHPLGVGLSLTSDPEGLAGHYQRDNAAPLGEHTFTSLRACAATTAHVATGVANGRAPTGYALCRPGGHHASRAASMGFCYLNNAAIAAQILRERWSRVAIIDLDIHHGNGTQEIFMHRSDVVTVSIHADPERFYPFYSGFAEERGVAAGRGANRNYPLPRGSGDGAWLDALDDAIRFLDHCVPDALVVSLGLDGHQNDPLGGFELTTGAFSAAGQRLSATGLPTVIVQEGGYLHHQLAPSLMAFLGAFR